MRTWKKQPCATAISGFARSSNVLAKAQRASTITAPPDIKPSTIVVVRTARWMIDFLIAP